MLTDTQRTLANALYDIGAIKFGLVNIKAHEKNPDLPKSPVYVNLRTSKHPVTQKRGPLTGEILWMIRHEIELLLDDLGWEFDLFTGIPDAGEPFADQIELLHFPSEKRLTLAKRTLPDGSRYISHVERGSFVPHLECVLVLDDVITGAGSKLETISVLESAGLTVWNILVLVDRCQGGADLLRQMGYNVAAVMTLPDMIHHYARTGRMTLGEAREALRYLEENQLS